MIRARAILSGIVSLATASCSVGPDYERPAVDTPAAYKSALPDQSKTPTIDRRWWTLFGDPELNRLEEAAVRSNLDVLGAVARVDEARAAARITDSQFFPALTFNPLAQRFRTSANFSRSGTGGITTNDFQLPLDFSYELDVWGKIRRASEASQAQAQATAYDLEVVLHEVESDVAMDYFGLRSLDAQDVILKNTVDLYQRQLTLLETQFKAGLVGRITIVQQETQLYSTVTQEVEVRRQRNDLEHALAILQGRAPADFSVAASPLDLVPPKIPAGVPAELLRKRPDVAEAERRLAASSANIGVAVAQFYPDFHLTGQAGLESADVRKLFEWQSRIWTLAASAVVPIFLGGQQIAALDQAKAQYEESLAGYRKSVLSAFGDVEDALNDLNLRAEAAEAAAKAVAAAREYVALSETQFKQGLISYLQVIDAQRALLTSELVAAQLLNQRLGSSVLLIKALGSGWSVDAKPEEN